MVRRPASPTQRLRPSSGLREPSVNGSPQRPQAGPDVAGLTNPPAGANIQLSIVLIGSPANVKKAAFAAMECGVQLALPTGAPWV